MAKAKLTTRAISSTAVTSDNLAKGSQLTHNQLDSNFINLRDQTFGIAADDSSTIQVGAGDTLYVQGAGGIATTTDSAGVITVDGSNLSSLGDLTAIGSTLVSPSNAAITLDPSGTGTIELNANTNITGNLTASGSLNTDGIEIHDNNIKATRTNDDLILQTNNTGTIELEANTNVTGTLTATTLAGTLSTAAQTNVTSLGTLSALQVDNINVNGNTITSTSSTIDLFTTGHQNINIGSNTGTGDGTGATTVEGTQFKRFANSTTGEWMNIPMSADGSTSQDVIFQMNSGKPELYFNSAGSAASDSAKIRVGTGGLTIQTDGSNSSDANIRIQSAGTITLDAAGQINLGGDTIVVSGNRMFTDASNEDFELLANGTGNISMLSPANMNSNKIINVTDPGAAQDAATKAYVDANVLSLIDEDSFGTNSETRPPSQQSVKAYVDTQDAAIASDTLTFTNKTFDADGTGNNLSNIEVANLKSGVLDTDLSSVAGTDTTLASAKAIKAYVDSQSGGSANTGDITFVGSTMISPSNADITLNPAGTGKVNINAVYTLPNADGSANQILGTNGSGVLSFRDPTAINIDGGVADSTYTSVPTIDGGTA